MGAGDDTDIDAGRDFERWALAGVAAVMAVAVAVVLLRAGGIESDEDPVKDPSAMVRVRIGAGGPAADLPPSEDDPVTPPRVDPWPTPPEPPHVEPAPLQRTYVVQRGDTLMGIAQAQLGSVGRMGEIIELNDIRDPNAIRAGDRLTLPAR